ncbi:hypothetical protein U9M48_011070 [Paspalum notatum var. saurae]|uniref:Calreticulin n=1 Tax=Paspalum notatum var. saurae TaxID=547442 RepID=A0AAQ3SUG4_PASNO
MVTAEAVLQRSSSIAAAGVAALIALSSVAVVAGEVFFQEKFDDGWEDRWVKSDWKKDDNTAGKWNHTQRTGMMRKMVNRQPQPFLTPSTKDHGSKRNPNYKGKWKAPLIDNPDYKDDPYVYAFDNLEHIGIELWQVKSGTLFDNILITDDPEYAKKFAEETWGKHKDAEKAAFDDVEKKRLEEESASTKDDDDVDEDEDDAADDKADNATEEAKNNSADAKPEDSKVAVDEKPAEDSKDASAEGEKHDEL